MKHWMYWILWMFSMFLPGRGYAQAGWLPESQALLEAGKREQAQALLEKGLEKSLAAGDSSLAAAALLELGATYLNGGDIKNCEEYYRKAETWGQRHNDTIWAQALSARATIREIMGDKAGAASLLFPVAEHPTLRARERLMACVIIGDALADMGVHDSARIYLDRSLELSRVWADSQSLTAIYQSYGNLEFYLDDYEASLSHYLNALDLFPSTMSRTGTPNIYNNIGQLYFFLDQPQEALAYARKGKALAQEFRSNYAYHFGWYVEAQAEAALGNKAEAIVALDSILVYFSKANRVVYQFRVLIDLARLHIGEGNVEYATQLIRQAEALADRVEGDKFELGRKLIRTDLHLAKKEWNTAENYLEEAQALATRIGIPRAQRNVLYRKAALYKGKGDYARALEATEAYQKIDREAVSLSRTRIVNEMQNKYDKARNEQQILQLTLDNQVQSEAIRRERNRFWTVLFFALLALASATVIFFQLRKINRQNKVIESALEERETLLREIHHRVKNNLQVISSLLFLQAETIKDEKALAALQEGRNRVKSMSLIHQNLYQEDHLIGVSTQTYFEKLIGSLFSTYRIDRERVVAHTRIDNLILDIDTLVPLALIVNELISNSLKHAFAADGQGEIRLELRKEGDRLFLRQSDNGMGFSGNWEDLKADSFGFQLIDILSKKLQATVTISGDAGFSFSLSCPIPSHV